MTYNCFDETIIYLITMQSIGVPKQTSKILLSALMNIRRRRRLQLDEPLKRVCEMTLTTRGGTQVPHCRFKKTSGFGPNEM